MSKFEEITDPTTELNIKLKEEKRKNLFNEILNLRASTNPFLDFDDNLDDQK